MKKLFKVVAVVLTVILSFSLFGCAGDGGDRSKMVAKIEITKMGKQLFAYNDPFSTGDLEVTKVMGDRKRTVLKADEYEVDSSAYSGATPGTYSIVVKHETKRATYSVMVIGLALESIEITTQPKKEFAYGEDFEAGSLAVSAVMSDGSKNALSAADYSIDSSEYNAEVPGTYPITVRYRSKTVTYDVVVNNFDENAALERLEIVTAGKVWFEVGEDFTAGSLAVRRVMADGSKFNLTAGSFTVDSSKFDSTKAGTYAITVSYTHMGVTKTIEYSVTVAATTSIKISKAGKTEFFAGDAFEIGGLEVSRVMSDGKEIKLAAAEYTVDSSAFKSVAGTYAIKIIYKTFNATYNVTVKAEYVPTPGQDVLYPILDTNKVVGNSRQYIFEAEYISLAGKTGSGHSGSAKDEQMIQEIAGASNGYMIGFMHGKDIELEFEIYASKAADVTMFFQLASEINTYTVSPNNLEFSVNGTVMDYYEFELDGVPGNTYGTFQVVEFITAAKLKLIEGKNSIKIKVLENTDKGGTTGGPGVDYLRIDTAKDVELKWKPLWGNMNRR